MYKKNTNNSPHLFTVQQAATYLGVSAGTIHRWVRAKQLHGIKVGLRGDWRFTESDLQKMIHQDQAREFIQDPKTQLVPRFDYNTIGQSEHFVQFYEHENFLLNPLTTFIINGLKAAESCIVIATKAHRTAIEKRLYDTGISVQHHKSQGQLVFLDAAETLSVFMVNGLPHKKRFTQVMGKVMKQASRNSSGVRAFGEMVALLWAEDNHTGAIELENLWNDLSNTYAFLLFCAYPMTGFNNESHSASFKQIGHAHSSVIPTETYNELENPDDRLRTIALLQQKAAALQAEVMERKEIEKRKDDFLSIASHELRTPVTSIKAFTQILLHRAMAAGEEQNVAILKRMDYQLTRLNELVADMLDVSRIQSGNLSLKKEPLLLDELINQAVFDVQHTVTSHTITFTNKASQCVVHADKDRLIQVLINLFENAIKYSPTAKNIVIHLYTQSGQTIVSVKDYGIGIPQTDQKRIFDRFYRVEEGGDAFPGQGLGLYIAAEIIKRHNGSISVESTVGEGTTFHFSLPMTSQTIARIASRQEITPSSTVTPPIQE